jgi:hypothetical protein
MRWPIYILGVTLATALVAFLLIGPLLPPGEGEEAGARWYYDPVGGSYALVIAVAALLLLGLILIVPARSRINGHRRAVLFGLRMLVILLLLAAMLRPTLVRTTTTPQSATLIVLLDRSRSMSVPDEAGKKTRWEAMSQVIEAAWPAMRKMGKDFEIKVYTFDSEAHAVDNSKDKLDLEREPEGHQTAIGWVIDKVVREEAGKRLAGVILLGDGAQQAAPPRDRSPQDAVRQLADQGVPLYSVPFGQARGMGQSSDIALDQLRANQQVFVKNRLSVAAEARVDGFANRSIPIQMLFETAPGKMEVVAGSQITALQDGQHLPVELEYVPQTPGEFKVTIKAIPQPGERLTTNNELSTFVTVLKGGLSVLYVEGALRYEQKFLRRSLDASPDIKVDYLRIDARKPETRPPDLLERFQPGKYDVYMFGDLDASAFRGEELAMLAKAVEEGAGFIMLGGFHSFGAGNYGQTPLADVLPIRIERLERQNFDEPIRDDLHITGPLMMRPTKVGATQSLMSLGDANNNLAVWMALPPLEGANRFRDKKPAANVLAETEQGQPLLVAKDFGRGRVIAFAADSTWRWWMGGHEAEHKRFWRQTVLWLARKDQSNEGNVWVQLDTRRLAPGMPLEFTVGANDPDGKLLTDARFEIEVIHPDRTKTPLQPRRQGDKNLVTFLGAEAAGDYTIAVKGTRAGETLGTTQARFLVFEQDRELDNPAADRGALESLAAITGGKAVPPEQLAALVAQIQKESQKLLIQTQLKTTLWDTWPFFLTFVLLLVIEWFLRKKWGMV